MKAKVHTLFVLLLLLTAVGCSERDRPATPAPTATAIAPSGSSSTTGLSSVASSATSLLDGAGPLHPRMVGQFPAVGEELPLDGTFEIYFDQPMRPEETDLVQVMDGAGNPIEGEVSWPQPRILRFSAAKRLQASSYYQITVPETAVSAAGIPLLEPLTRFRLSST